MGVGEGRGESEGEGEGESESRAREREQLSSPCAHVQEAEHLLFGQQDEFDSILKEETKARLEPVW